MALKIFEASRRLAAITAQFTAAGLDIEQFIAATDDTALKAHLESQKPSGAAATKDLQAQLEQLGAQHSALSAQHGHYTAALAAVGVKLAAADEKAGLTAADIEAGIRARASIMAQEQLAKAGLPAPLPLAPAADATKPAAAAQPELKGLKKVHAAFAAETAARAAHRAV